MNHTHLDTLMESRIKSVGELKDLRDAVEIFEFIPDRLYFATYDDDIVPTDTDSSTFFNTDDTLLYLNYMQDFGPLSLGKLYRFCRLLYGKLVRTSTNKKKIIYWTLLEDAKRSNSAFLIGCFAVILLAMSPKEVMTILSKTNYKYCPFNDVIKSGAPGQTISLNDCFSAINKGCYFNIVNFADFNLEEYEDFEGANIDARGDLSWIVPQKLLALSGPCGIQNGNWMVEAYIDYFKKNSVNTVIRLNNRRYDAKQFTQHGIDHYDLIFPDGSVPPDDILNDFLEIVEVSDGAAGVHCKAGLGRTGCLIGVYLMKHYRMTATEAIAWMRICRPGCVIGQQQPWLESKQSWAWKQGDRFRDELYHSPDKVRQHKYGIYSIRGKGATRLRSKVDPKTSEKLKRIQTRIQKRNFYNRDIDNEGFGTQGDVLVAARFANTRR